MLTDSLAAASINVGAGRNSEKALNVRCNFQLYYHKIWQM